MKIIKFCCVMLVALALGGCATIFSPKTKHVTVTAVSSATNKPVPGARCIVRTGDGGAYPVSGNPGSVNVTRGSGAMAVDCSAKGYQRTTQGVGSSLTPWTIANVLFWPGFIVDAVTGAITKYPDHATVVMSRR